jgi:hypothetical protein
VFDADEAIVTIEILGGNRVLIVGDRRALSLQAWLADLSQGDYTLRAVWKSSHPSIVKVNDEGVLTALAPGMASLFAQIGEHSAQIEITVQEDTAIGLVLQPSPVRLMSGREHTLTIEQILQGNRQEAIEPTDCRYDLNPASKTLPQLPDTIFKNMTSNFYNQPYFWSDEPPLNLLFEKIGRKTAQFISNGYLKTIDTPRSKIKRI